MTRKTYTTQIGFNLYDLTDWRLSHERPPWSKLQKQPENSLRVGIRSILPVSYVVRKSDGSASIKNSARQSADSNTTTMLQPKRDEPGLTRMIPLSKREKEIVHWTQSLYRQSYNKMETRCDTCGILFKRKSISQCFCTPVCRDALYTPGTKIRRGFAALLAEL